MKIRRLWKSEYSQKDANGKGMTSDCVTSAQITLSSEKLLENEKKNEIFSLSFSFRLGKNFSFWFEIEWNFLSLESYDRSYWMTLNDFLDFFTSNDQKKIHKIRKINSRFGCVTSNKLLMPSHLSVSILHRRLQNTHIFFTSMLFFNVFFCSFSLRSWDHENQFERILRDFTH